MNVLLLCGFACFFKSCQLKDKVLWIIFLFFREIPCYFLDVSWPVDSTQMWPIIHYRAKF